MKLSELKRFHLINKNKLDLYSIHTVNIMNNKYQLKLDLNGNDDTVNDSHDSNDANNFNLILPKNLWKPDQDSIECDIVTCSTAFSLLERRHHCRKCGGIFCQLHSSHKVNLINHFNNLYLSRVCDDCYQDLYQFNGNKKIYNSSLVHSQSNNNSNINSKSLSSLSFEFQPTTPQLCISPTSSSSISSPSSSLPKQHINSYYSFYNKLFIQQQQQQSYFVNPQSSTSSMNNNHNNANNKHQGPFYNYVLASTSARQASGRLPPYTPPITPSPINSTKALHIPSSKHNNNKNDHHKHNVIVDGDIKVNDQSVHSLGQSLAKSLTWAWSTF